MLKKVTVGIPTYNRPDGLLNTLKTICSQTYANLEILISDNCSSFPEVSNVLNKFRNDARITIFQQESNIGIVPNFQYLLDKATGFYFMWAADDDNWDNNFIEECVKTFETKNQNVSVVMSNYYTKDLKGTLTKKNFDFNITSDNVIYRSWKLVNAPYNIGYCFCGLFNTEIAKSIKFLNYWGGDHMFVYELVLKGKVVHCKSTNFYYTVGGTSSSISKIRNAFNIRHFFFIPSLYVFKYCTYQLSKIYIPFLTRLVLVLTNFIAILTNKQKLQNLAEGLISQFFPKSITAVLKETKRKI